MAIGLRTDNPSFLRMLEERYGGFLSASTRPDFEFEIDLAPPGKISEDEDVRVVYDSGRWSIERGDFRAEWDPAFGRGRIRQSINPYSIDSVLRIVHTLLLARSGGFLAHAASAVRNGRAFLFAGRSGAGWPGCCWSSRGGWPPGRGGPWRCAASWCATRARSGPASRPPGPIGVYRGRPSRQAHGQAPQRRLRRRAASQARQAVPGRRPAKAGRRARISPVATMQATISLHFSPTVMCSSKVRAARSTLGTEAN